ncbi:unnamed protein product [Adineta steineri]|uniref:G-protein coupled receptors family 1 profile domain-containing protein n=1 Tax=Adineta steineri TaxID=433720 RepID=A0A814IC40_9BILA|nr:unnamed protein product [Adineta steineri]CAF1043867.1 unnamed protein product [Adineta steineri]
MSTILTTIGKQVTIYLGMPVFISGIVGGILNLIVFLSLHTFRQSSCAFYLIIMSILNIGQLFCGYFSLRIINALIGVDLTAISLFFCKFRIYISQLCSGLSLTCLCLATIDQYLATCSRVHWQQLCKIKLAYRLVLISTLIWILHGIPYLIYFNDVLSSSTNQTSCVSVNSIFNNYRNNFFIVVLIGYLPMIIASLFGLLAYHNLQQMSHRTIPLIRRELDKQLTTMVLVQVIVNIFTLLPYTTINAITTNPNLANDSNIQEKLQFALTIINPFYYAYFSVSINELLITLSL